MNDDIARAERAKRGSPYLNTAQAAHYLGVSGSYLEKLRARKEGPLTRHHAKMTLYHIDDLQTWSLARTQVPRL